MNLESERCDEALITRFLQHDLQSPEQNEFVRHLDHCESCAAHLESKTAGHTWWQAANRFLPDGPHELEPLSDDSLPTDPAAKNLMVQQVLDHLTPTDDPRMLGRLGSYEIVGVIGSGGMGVVLKGFDAALDRYVAIKTLSPTLAASGPARKRFSREARAAAAVVHDNVSEIYGVSEADGLPYLVMPYVRGASLQRRLDDSGSMFVIEILRIGMQTAAGLAAAHGQGLVHRDIKPGNILLSEGVERVQITDFGLARAADDASLTRTGTITGTPQFMSPEQARGESVDQRSDLFSLGSVMYTMCTGRPPFRAETSYGILRRITDTEPRPIREINADVPQWLCGIIAKLMAKRPDDRFASAAEVADLLEDCLAHVQQPTTVPLPQSCVSSRESSKTDQASGASPRFRRRPPARAVPLFVAATFVFTLLFAGIVIVLESNKGTLIIECEADDVPIRIMRGDEVVERLTVTRSGESVRVAAGEYAVVIDDKSDQIVVKDGVVSLKRGDTETVRIVRAPDAIDTPIAPASPHEAALGAAETDTDEITVDLYGGSDVLPQVSSPTPSLTARRHSKLLLALNAIKRVTTNFREAGPGDEIQMVIVRDPSKRCLRESQRTGKPSEVRTAVDSAMKAAGIRSVRWEEGIEEENEEGKVPATVDSARIVPLNDLQAKGQRLVQLDRVAVEGDFDLSGRSPSAFYGGNAEVVVGGDQRTKTSLAGTVTFINPQTTDDGKNRILATVENRQIDGKWLLVPGESATLTIHAAKSRDNSSDPDNAGDNPPTESDGLYRFPTEFEGQWRIVEAITGGHTRDDYAGQVAEISGGSLVLRSKTEANTYHVTFVDPSNEQIALDLIAYPPNGDKEQAVTFHCVLKISDSMIRLCRPQNPQASRPKNLELPERSETVFKFVRDDNDPQHPSSDTWKRPEDWLRVKPSDGRGADHEEEILPNSVGMRFVQIPAGEFSMGRSQPYDEILRLTTIYFGVDRAIKTEVPQHRVRIAPFLMQTTEVTQQQWKDVMGTRPWNNKDSFVKEGPEYPATYITWDDAQEFCLRLSKTEGKTYRLPTEAEWEYACRAQSSTLYSFGDSPAEMPDYGWITDNAYSIGESFAHPVARQKPNAWGLYDMHGNVWEWCSDWLGEDYYEHSAEDDPRGPSDGTTRVIRGGSWRSSDTHARSTFRFGLSPSDAENDLGFRVVAVPSRETEIDLGLGKVPGTDDRSDKRANPAERAVAWGDLKGRFVLDGERPNTRTLGVSTDQATFGGSIVDESLIVDRNSKGIANVLLFVRTTGLRVHPDYAAAAKKPQTMTFADGYLRPRVATLRVGQPLVLQNTDDVGHNPKIDTLLNQPRNALLPPDGRLEYSFASRESRPAPVSGAIHPWLRGWLMIADHPYMAVTDKDGAFELRNLPTGELEFQCWHERTGWLAARPEWERGRFRITLDADGMHDLGTVEVSAMLLDGGRGGNGSKESVPDAVDSAAKTMPVEIALPHQFRMHWPGAMERSPTTARFAVPVSEPSQIRLDEIVGHHGLEIGLTIEPADFASSDEFLKRDQRLRFKVGEEELAALKDGKPWTFTYEEEQGTVIAVFKSTARQRPVTPIADVKELDGTWRLVDAHLVSDQAPGLPFHDSESYKSARIAIDGPEWRYVRNGNEVIRTLEASYDLTASPQKVDLKFTSRESEKHERRLIERHGDTMITARRASDAGDFPPSFDEPMVLIEQYQRVVGVVTVESQAYSDLITISLGAADGILVKQRLQISDDSTVLGMIEIDTVREYESYARVVQWTADRPIRKGDRVKPIQSPDQEKVPGIADSSHSAIEGNVITSTEEWVEIAIGQDDGVKVGMTFVVSHKGVYRGVIEITSLSADRSVGRIIPMYNGAPIAAGDKVVRRTTVSLKQLQKPAEIFARWRRWEIRFPNDSTEFSHFLDFFGIDFGVADVGGREIMMLFYPEETDQLLTKLEAQFADGESILQVDKTVFGVRPKADGFEFYVISQSEKPTIRSDAEAVANAPVNPKLAEICTQAHAALTSIETLQYQFEQSDDEGWHTLGGLKRGVSHDDTRRKSHFMRQPLVIFGRAEWAREFVR